MKTTKTRCNFLKLVPKQNNKIMIHIDICCLDCQGVEYENACYFLLDQGGSDSMKSYSEAESACHIKQARLATMDNQPMYDVLYDYVKKNAQDFVNKARSLVLIWTGASYTVRNLDALLSPRSTLTILSGIRAAYGSKLIFERFLRKQFKITLKL